MRTLIVIGLISLTCVCFQTDEAVGVQAAFRQIFSADNSLCKKQPASLQAFDISPDGSLLALLFQSKSQENNWLQLLIEDVRTGKTKMDIELNALGVRPDFNNFPWYEPHVEFSADQRFLMIQDWQTVQIVDVSAAKVVRILTSSDEQLSLPLAIHTASGSVLVSYGTKVPFAWGNKGFNDLVPPRRVRNELVDISTGQRQSTWESLDIPQSISADGKLAAVSEWEGSTPLVEIEIVDAHSGKKLKTLISGYGFKKTWAPGPAGRVIGKFLNNDEIVLSPDEHVDRSGHRSGESLKIVRVSDGQVVQQIRPSNFGPSGEMAVSPGRDCFVLLNWYISPGEAKHDTAPARGPELMVFPNPEKPSSYAVLSLQKSRGLETNQWIDAWRPRVSNDAATVAVAGSRNVIVFERN